MPSSSYLRQKLMDLAFRNQAWAPPITWYVALFTSATDDASGGTEVAGNAYARQVVAFTAADATGVVRNTSTILFPVATPDGWGYITHIGIYDAALGGNRLWHGPLLGGGKWSYAQERFRFPAGQLALQLT